MRAPSDAYPNLATILLLAAAALVIAGCSRTNYRLQADRDAYHLIAEKNTDPRWSASDYRIEMDPRSRYFDGYDPDRSPMPPDDPASHQLMHRVDGKKGWKHWHRNGDRIELENPAWREALANYVELTEDGGLELDIDAAIRLAYVHSPLHQSQLETLYLSALDVSAERFQFDTQFFGGYDTRYAHVGGLNPPGFRFDPVTNSFVVQPASARNEQNRLTEGRAAFGVGAAPFGLVAAARKAHATAGELLVGFANSFVWEFTGGDASLASSLAGFNLIQPLLRGAGRDVALEQLTFEERNLLANLRAYSQFRQGFYTQVAIGELGVTGPQRFGGDTSLQSFSGTGGVGGYLGLLQQRQQIRNSEANLSLQLRTRDRLEALLESEFIDIVQVDQFRQNVEAQRAALLFSQNALELALDRYKASTLGLPPDLSIELDESLIGEFQLFPTEAAEIQAAIVQLSQQVSELPDLPKVETLAQLLDDCFNGIEPVRELFDTAREDLARMIETVPTREQAMTDKQKQAFKNERERLGKLYADLQRDFAAKTAELSVLVSGLTPQTRAETRRSLISWIREYLQLVERFSLVPAQARLEAITVDAVELEADEALQIALANRLDFMNGRAALVNRWRLVQVNADALQSVLNVTANGDVSTARNNPFSFRAPTGTLRLGLEFDVPYTRLLERNAYRESLIEYQRSRRSFIQSRDSLHLGLRALLRNLEQLRKNLEIQRGAVAIAIRRVDQTQLSLNPPREPPPPGQRPPINPTTAINLLGAQTSLRDTQNAFLDAWLNYYAARLRLYRELGVMTLDEQGRWIETPIGGADGADGAPREELPLPPDVPEAEELPAPPMVPVEFIRLADYKQLASAVQQASHSTAAWNPAADRIPAAGPYGSLRRLPPVTREAVSSQTLRP